MLHTAERDNSRTEEENKKACTAISAFFAEKIRKIRESLKSELAGISINHLSFDAPQFAQSLTALSMVTPAEVIKLITLMSAKSSPADFVPTPVIKACPCVFSEIISKLANRSFAECRFPENFKHAQVTPLLKKDGSDKNNSANYRPISNLKHYPKSSRDWRFPAYDST